MPLLNVKPGVAVGKNGFTLFLLNRATRFGNIPEFCIIPDYSVVNLPENNNVHCLKK